MDINIKIKMVRKRKTYISKELYLICDSIKAFQKRYGVCLIEIT